MGKTAARLWFVPMLAVLLAACGGGKETLVDPNLPPSNYKSEILTLLTKTLDDPTNVHDAYISDPVLTQVGSDQRFTLCVRYNARNMAGDYAGSKERIAYFFGGHLNQFVAPDQGQCAKAIYKPFPELEKLCKAAKCN
jgi:hypothetical protein